MTDNDVDLLQEQISALTERLKNMNNTDPAYPELWDKRIELKIRLRDALVERS